MFIKLYKSVPQYNIPSSYAGAHQGTIYNGIYNYQIYGSGGLPSTTSSFNNQIVEHGMVNVSHITHFYQDSFHGGYYKIFINNGILNATEHEWYVKENPMEVLKKEKLKSKLEE